MKNKIDEILHKEVTRKEFLQHAGFALLAMTGFAGLIKGLQLDTKKSALSMGYGSSAYGGTKKT